MSCNGWSNRATWLAHLWIYNDESLSSFAIEVAEKKNKWKAAESLKKTIEDIVMSDIEGLARDLLQEVLSQVNWVEVVENLRD